MGEREMWPKLATIESNCGIEMQLDECVRALREKLSQRQGYMNLKQRGRVPSWNTINYCGRDSYLHMPQTGGSIASTITMNDNNSDAGLVSIKDAVHKGSFAATVAANNKASPGAVSTGRTDSPCGSGVSMSMSRIVANANKWVGTILAKFYAPIPQLLSRYGWRIKHSGACASSRP